MLSYIGACVINNLQPSLEKLMRSLQASRLAYFLKVITYSSLVFVFEDWPLGPMFKRFKVMISA
jgi:hypothetical protein